MSFMLVRRDSDDMREFRPRAALGAVIVVCALLVLVVRLYQLQILRGEDYVNQANSNFRKQLFVPADRGLIKDATGRTLVDNRPSFDVFMTPAFCVKSGKGGASKGNDAVNKGNDRDTVIAKLAAYLHLDAEDVERIQSDYEESWYSKDKLERFKPFLVALDIPRDQVDVIEAHKTEMNCVDLIPSPHRAYRASPSLGHVLGYMSEVKPDELKVTPKDRVPYRVGQMIGRAGLERRWEQELRGREGREKIAVDAKGQRLDKDTQEQLIPEGDRLVQAEPGNNLVLSIDHRLQEAADIAFPGRAGAVVVMEAKTGFLLALLSRPAYDPNKMSGRISREELATINADPLKPMLFRATNENYHPGSTFKVVTSLAALEKGAINPSAGVYCPGFFAIGSHRWRCDKPSGHGFLSLTEALQYSCDVYYYTVADRIGLDPIAEMAHRLGYGQPTGFIPGETPGIIPDQASVAKALGAYTRGHAVNASIGQGEVNVTPIQQAVAYAAIANGGTLWKPQIVRRVETPTAETIKVFAPELDTANGRGGKVDVKPAYLEAVRKGLFAVVNEHGGTAYRSRLSEVAFAGKTGTAQVMKLGQKQKLDPVTQAYFSRDHAWFASYAPAEDPEIVVVVLNEHGGWGAEAAAPAASKIIRTWFQLKKQDAAAAAAVASAPASAPDAGPIPSSPVAPPPVASAKVGGQ